MLLPAFFQGTTQFLERVYSSLLKDHSLPYSLTNLAEGRAIHNYLLCGAWQFLLQQDTYQCTVVQGLQLLDFQITMRQILSFLALLRLGWLQPWGTKYVPKEPEPKSKAPAGSQRLDRGILDQTYAKLRTKSPLHDLKSSLPAIQLTLAANHHLSGCLHGHTTPSYQHWEWSPSDGRQKRVVP